MKSLVKLKNLELGNVLCVEFYTLCNILVYYFTLCLKLYTQCKAGFFCVPDGKFYTWDLANLFTQPAVVMVVTNIKYAPMKLSIIDVLYFEQCGTFQISFYGILSVYDTIWRSCFESGSLI